MASTNDTAAVRKQLKIKTGVVKRLLKEVTLYQKEEEAEVVKVEKLKADGAEPADLRRAEIILKEAQKMTPDAQERLGKSVADLRDLTIQAMSLPGMEGDTELVKAKEAIEEAEL